MGYEHIEVERAGDFATITMNRPQRRNALSLEHMRELITAFGEVGNGDARGIVLAGHGPAFSAGHDFADMAGADLPYMQALMTTCTDLMTLIQQVPQPVLERATRRWSASKGIGEPARYAQIDRDQPKARANAGQVLAATSQLPDEREGMQAFLEKRKANGDR